MAEPEPPVTPVTPNPKVNPSGGGDPHFTTWTGERYSYHGACDLVLLSSKQFGNGQGIDVHIRTKHRHYFSFITSAAIRIGEDILEITDDDEDVYFLNGEANVDLPAKLSGYKITHKYDNKRQQTFHIVLGGHENLVVRVLKDFVSVTIKHGESQDFEDAVGLMGAYTTGHKLGRDGETIFEDIDAFGQEWQVLESEPKLFQTVRAPQHPVQCIPAPPKTEMRRRLGEEDIDRAAAEKVCAGASEEDREFCIFDVMATNDVDMAGAY